jgi:RimJ/RimL family protein N-acetyltransferase
MTSEEMTFDGLLVTGNPALWPHRTAIEGTYASLEPLDAASHGDSLWQNAGGDSNEVLWRYMHSGPFSERTLFDAYLTEKASSKDPLYFAILDRGTCQALGHAAYMRIDTSQRVIEVGSIVFTQQLQRTRAATEAMYLMARHVFEDLGYRRYEWKCNVLNRASRRAAMRFGFTFEGIFRQHMIVKDRNRDTAWFAMLDFEWPERKKEFERWLAPGNFDVTGQQKTRLNHS